MVILAVFLHGDLLPRQVKIRQTVAENATYGMWRTIVWRGEKSPCENTKKSPYGGFSRGAFSRFRPEKRLYYMAQISHHKNVINRIHLKHLQLRQRFLLSFYVPHTYLLKKYKT